MEHTVRIDMDMHTRLMDDNWPCESELPEFLLHAAKYLDVTWSMNVEDVQAYMRARRILLQALQVVA